MLLFNKKESVDYINTNTLFGGESEIRTPAGLASSSSFRNCPLQPLG